MNVDYEFKCLSKEDKEENLRWWNQKNTWDVLRVVTEENNITRDWLITKEENEEHKFSLKLPFQKLVIEDVLKDEKGKTINSTFCGYEVVGEKIHFAIWGSIYENDKLFFKFNPDTCGYEDIYITNKIIPNPKMYEIAEIYFYFVLYTMNYIIEEMGIKEVKPRNKRSFYYLDAKNKKLIKHR